MNLILVNLPIIVNFYWALTLETLQFWCCANFKSPFFDQFQCSYKALSLSVPFQTSSSQPVAFVSLLNKRELTTSLNSLCKFTSITLKSQLLRKVIPLPSEGVDTSGWELLPKRRRCHDVCLHKLLNYSSLVLMWCCKLWVLFWKQR